MIHILLCHRLTRFAALLVCFIGLSLAVGGAARAPAAASAPRRGEHSRGERSPGASAPDALQALSADTAFLLAEGRLHRTADGGASWTDSTPPGAAILAIHFTGADTGIAVTSPHPIGPHDPTAIGLATTQDGGRTWAPLEPVLPGASDDPPVAQAHLFFLSPQDGWLTWRFAGSSNFRTGALFRTRDGGRTWQRMTLPFGEPVRFADPDNGWLAGGPAGDALYHTTDGGRTWARVTVGAPVQVGREARPQYGLPVMHGSRAVLPVTWTTGDQQAVAFYAGAPTGGDWRLIGTEGIPSGDAPQVAGGPETLVAHAGTLWAVTEEDAPEPRGSGPPVSTAHQRSAW